MNKLIKKSLFFFIVSLFLITTSSSAVQIVSKKSDIINKKQTTLLNDEIEITFTVKEIRAYDNLDKFSDPDFYVVLNIDGEKIKSPVWKNQKYVKEEWSYTFPAPLNKDNITIIIELWDQDVGFDKLCDLTKNDDNKKQDRAAIINYHIPTGHWYGSDYLFPYSTLYDESGYGRLNGCDDHTYNINDRDCELIFDITQTDIDGDGIPPWVEVNVYKTDPTVNDTGRDDDNDGVPIEWEYKWGHYFHYNWWNETVESYWFYNPFIWEDHAHFDFDKDGLDNIEEYKTSKWGSNPYRQDIFLELDQMEIGENEKGEYIPDLSKEMLRDAFGKRNIMFLIDDGWMGGGELIPFNESTPNEDLRKYYYQYFLHEDYDNWRQGAFHYALILYNSTRTGFCFWGGDENYPYLDSFQLNRKINEQKIYEWPLLNIIVNKKLDRYYRKSVLYASAMMHETGHILGINGFNTPGCDNPSTYFPWQKGWWRWRFYRSCMNYAFVYQIVDYSDGSCRKNDFDDWARIDLTLFQG
ncbi:MAG: hypothetical protein QHH15_02305 [Candidatus Thermoplasmatota archaeon]|jgi:hypothetical protein|nr:hypothetical protein [Candidatus Thermoplasmatota archaeon]